MCHHVCGPTMSPGTDCNLQLIKLFHLVSPTERQTEREKENHFVYRVSRELVEPWNVNSPLFLPAIRGRHYG